MNKIKELDGLRGILAVWVVCVHLLYSVGVSPRMFGFFAPLFGEHLRVQIFCILSGFVIFLMQSRVRQGYRAFLVGRLRRLYPAYILAFGVSVSMSGIALTAAREASFGGARQGSRIEMLEASLDRFPEHIAAHLTMLHGMIPEAWLPDAAYSFLGQAWNISTEFQFYLVAPLLFVGLACGALWSRLVCGLAVLGAWFLLRDWPNPASLMRYAPYFAVGMLSFVFWKVEWRDRRRLNPGLVLVSSVALFGLLDMAVGIWVFVLGWLVLVRDQSRGRLPVAWLATRPMQLLGSVSYSLYLLHMTPLYLGMYLLNGQGLERKTYLVFLTLFTFVLALPMAWISFVHVERRFHGAKLRAKRAEAIVLPAE